MKKNRILFLISGIILKSFFHVAWACNKERNFSLNNNELTIHYMANFLSLCAENSNDVYKIPSDTPENFIPVTSRIPGVRKEPYQLFNFLENTENNKPLCWWLMIPSSFSSSFEIIQLEVDCIVMGFQNEEKRNKISSFIKKTFKNWNVKDFYTHIFLDKNSPIEVNFFEIYNQVIEKVIYLGISPTTPSWISQNYSALKY